MRTATAEDWPGIKAVADEALPQAPDGNEAWIGARIAIDDNQTVRRHYVVEEVAHIVAYGAIELSGNPGWYRLFLVTRPDRLALAEVSELFETLLGDLRALGARRAWMREHADDPVLAFALARGFLEARRYALGTEHGAYAGIEVVETELNLGD